MDRDTIIRLARDAAFHTPVMEGELLRFAALVAAHEREECAKLCDAQAGGRRALEHYAALTYSGAANDCAGAIRNRK